MIAVHAERKCLMRRIALITTICIVSFQLTACNTAVPDITIDPSAIEIETSTETSPESSIDNTTVITTTTTTMETTPTTTVNVAQHQEYKKALLKLLNKRIWPGTKRKEEFLGSKMSENEFAIADVDMDGRDELIINWNPQEGMCYLTQVLEYDVETKKWKTEGDFYPYGTEFYDNGIVFVPFSHNQGWGSTIYPYSIAKYNPKKDKFKLDIGNVSCWDKECIDQLGDYEGAPQWPYDVDKEKAGVVYIIDYKEYDTKKQYSQTDYNKFLDDLVGDANLIPVKFKSLTKKNINKIVSVD